MRASPSLPAGLGVLALLPPLVLLAACSSGKQAEQVKEIAVNVVTLQSGTTSELRDRRDTGPFVEYDVPPDEMLDVLEGAMLRAGGADGPPWVKAYPSRRYGEVVGKEFEKPTATYKDTFRTAAIAIVHPDPDDPARCRVEMHHTRRGPFHGGSVRWQAGLPGWIDEELAERAAKKVKPIP